ncbi:MAG: DegT/DnrJ/EryC1/StrS family aminotransferase [Chloroflexaceae bacterium]|nr:DegT/DnrJ/EryC1/StrS family aminotransferase [Chloroflexaceae bacterium]
MNHLSVPFGDLGRQYRCIQAEIDAAVERVLRSGWYILGAEVAAFEQEFAACCGVAYGVGVASGTDALYLALVALGIGPGDEVITVANAGMYQAAAIIQTGACPVFVDIVPEVHTIDPRAVEAAITPRTRAVLPVHLYGRMADMPAVMAVASRAGLAVVEDAAQAHGAWAFDHDGNRRQAGAWGTCGCWSFYPSKNLGALGDGGAVVTDDAALAERLRRLRQYGWGSKYIVTEAGGRNSRLDEMQAAILRVKLGHLEAWNAARRERAAWYGALLAGLPLELPSDTPGHVYHLYVVASDRRDALRSHLTTQGIGTDIHYPLPAHLQPAYAAVPMRPTGAGSLPHTERQTRRILSLPMYPELTRSEVEQVAMAVQEGNKAAEEQG